MTPFLARDIGMTGAAAPPASSSSERISRVEGIAVVALAAVTLFAVAWRIGNPALWHDEHFSLAFAQESWGDIFGRLWGVDAHRPTYYALLKAWMALFGNGQGTARMLGGVLAAASVPVVWLIGRTLGGARVGLLAAGLVALSPLFIAQARDLRMYPLLTLSLLLAVLAIALILKRGNHAGLWALFSGASSLAFYAQSSAALFVPLVGLALAILAVTKEISPRLLVGFCGACLLWLALILPGLWPAIHHTRDTLADFWIPAPTLGWVWSQAAGAYPYPAWGKPIVLAALLGGLAAAWRADRRAFWLLVVLVAGTPLLFWMLSYIRPILIVRAFAWTSVLAAVVMAFALAALDLRVRTAAFAVLVGLQLLALRPFYPATPQLTDFERLAPELASFDPKSDILVLSLSAFEPSIRYNHPWLRDADMRAFSYRDRLELFQDLLWSEHLNRSAASTMPLDGRRVWLLSETNPMFRVPPEDDVVAAVDAVRARGDVLRTVDAGRLRLELIATAPGR